MTPHCTRKNREGNLLASHFFSYIEEYKGSMSDNLSLYETAQPARHSTFSVSDLNPFYFKHIKSKSELRAAAIQYIDLLFPYIDDYGSFRLLDARLLYYARQQISEDEKKRMSEASEEMLQILRADKLVEPTGTNGLYYKLTDDGRKAKKIGRVKFLNQRTPWKERGRNWIWVELLKSIIAAAVALLAGLATFQLKHQESTQKSKPTIQQKVNVDQNAVLDSSKK